LRPVNGRGPVIRFLLAEITGIGRVQVKLKIVVLREMEILRLQLHHAAKQQSCKYKQ
jgi:hypothetical protein